jgi:hypothetical protein
MSLSGDTVKRENLSLGGAGILSDLAIARGEYLALKVTFATQAAAIEIELAPVHWVKPGSFGVEFIRIAPASQQRLQTTSPPWKAPPPTRPNPRCLSPARVNAP